METTMCNECGPMANYELISHFCHKEAQYVGWVLWGKKGWG